MENAIRRVLVVANHVLMVAGVTLLLCWIIGDLQGFSSSGETLFNYHPLCMFTAFAVLLSETMILNALWRIPRKVHIALHALILCIALSGFAVVLTFHLTEGFANFVSVHSYAGLATLSLLVLQNVVGALMYYCHCLDAWRASYVPKHRFFGVVIFVCALATVTLGLFDKQSLIQNADQLSSAKLIPNVLAVIVIAIGIVSLYLIHDAPELGAPHGAAERDPRVGSVNERLRPLMAEDASSSSSHADPAKLMFL